MNDIYVVGKHSKHISIYGPFAITITSVAMESVVDHYGHAGHCVVLARLSLFHLKLE
jgi:hypothetical protein